MEARWVPAGAALLALLAFAPAVTGGFSYDDLEAIRGNPVIEGSTPWWTAFTRDYWEHLGAAGHWRPTATLSLRLVHALFGESAPAQHAASLVLHACAAALLARLLLGLDLAPRRAALAAALFAAHPALADGVAWISGRSSPASAVGGLVGLLLLLRARTASMAALAAGLAVLLAALGKEDGLTFAPVAVLVAARQGNERAAVLGALLGGVAWATLRLATYGEALPSAPGSPLAELDLWEREALGGWAWLGGLRALLLPLGLVPGRAPLAVEDWAAAWPSAGVLVAHALPLLGLTLSWRALVGPRSHALVAGSVGCACLATLPTLQVIPAGEVFATRFLYLPLLFAAPALALALGRLGTRGQLLLLVALLPLSWRATAPYSSREAYWQARLAAEPEDARVWNALGNAALERGDLAPAEARFLRAVELDPDYSRPRVNLGVLLARSGELQRAEAVLAEACARGPRNPVAHQNHGAVLLRLERWEPAAAAYERATELAPGSVAAWRGLGRARRSLGDERGSRAALERALALDPRDARTRSLLEQVAPRPLEQP